MEVYRRSRDINKRKWPFDKARGKNEERVQYMKKKKKAAVVYFRLTSDQLSKAQQSPSKKPPMKFFFNFIMFIYVLSCDGTKQRSYVRVGRKHWTDANDDRSSETKAAAVATTGGRNLPRRLSDAPPPPILVSHTLLRTGKEREQKKTRDDCRYRNDSLTVRLGFVCLRSKDSDSSTRIT
ncbi:hypothetical protein AAG570_004671 [Ranatra chinensis]|uniref:Uncharacterized protein n=1 Tax=Ranatra chinensis TaxID=642074 RepID=A0ABD0Y2Y5_9HEMI